MNQGAQFVRHLENMLVLARVIAEGARNRDESRGAHYKPEYPDREDAQFLKATIATYDPATESAKISYNAVDTSLVVPRPRTYGKKPDAKPAAAAATAPIPARAGV